MLARVSWKPRAKAEPKVRRLNRDKQRHLVEQVVKILKAGEPTHFAFEAACRHGLRSRLCLNGWNWQEADDTAKEIVAAALNRIGAYRPTWAEGQPEYAQNGAGTMIERTRCVRCHGPLPEGHFKFCSDLCAGAHHMAQAREADKDSVNATWNAWQAAWMERQEPRKCPGCETMFQPRRPKQRFCCNACVGRFNAFTPAERKRFSNAT